MISNKEIKKGGILMSKGEIWAIIFCCVLGTGTIAYAVIEKMSI